MGPPGFLSCPFFFSPTNLPPNLLHVPARGIRPHGSPFSKSSLRAPLPRRWFFPFFPSPFPSPPSPARRTPFFFSCKAPWKCGLRGKSPFAPSNPKFVVVSVPKPHTASSPASPRLTISENCRVTVPLVNQPHPSYLPPTRYTARSGGPPGGAKLVAPVPENAQVSPCVTKILVQTCPRDLPA